ncbi:MAG: radical SAM protein [Candidatus Margulisiibacteriota bacterium]
MPTCDVLFVHPGNHKKTYQDLANEFTAIATPAWTMLLAGYCRNNGHPAAIYDVNVEGWTETKTQELVAQYSPKLIVIMVYGHNPSASTQTMPAAIKIANDIKSYNKDIPLAVGGIHPSALPERTLQETGADYIIQGEGPYTLAGLMKVLSGKADLKDVPGLWFRENGEAKFTQPSLVVADLDRDLSDYAWDLLPPISKYRAHNSHTFQDFEKSSDPTFGDIRSPYVAMNTSLGCPFNCSYCCINAIFGKPGIRYWSIEKVMSWMDELVNKYHVKHLRFDDELFILNPARVEQFCDALIDRGYDLNIWVYARVDTIRDNLLAKMKKAGINWVCLGIEAGNEKVRNAVNKRIGKDIKEVVRSIQGNGIYILGNYMFGLPEDDLVTMEETFKLSQDLNCEFVNYYSVMAYPGSQLYNLAAQKGQVPDKWEAFSQHSYDTQPLPTNHVSPAQVLKFRDEAFNRYFDNDGYMKMVEEKFGRKVVEHLDRMLQIKIKRRILDVV